MMSIVLAQGIALLFLLLLSAFFSSSETALFSLDSLQIRQIHEKHPAAGRRIKRFLSEPRRLLSTILIGNTVVNVVAASVGFALCQRLFSTHAESIAITLVTFLLLIFGEVGPKRLAIFWPAKLSTLYAPILDVTIKGLTVFRLGLEMITRWIEPFFIGTGHSLTEEEFKTVVHLSGQEGVLHREESQMIHAIIRLADLRAHDVMTPRVDIIGVDLDDDPSTILDIAQSTSVKQVVLFRHQLDHVEGILSVRDYLLDPEHNLDASSSPPFYVPETTPLDSLLAQFQERSRYAAVVVDEYGGTAGIITRGDVLEEIVGEIDEDRVDRTPRIQELGLNRWFVDASVSLEELNQKLGLSLEAEGADRLAGWIETHLERIPRPGDIAEAQQCKVTVQHMRRHRITLALVQRMEDSP